MKQFHSIKFLSPIGIIELTCRGDSIIRLTAEPVHQNKDTVDLKSVKTVCPVCDLAVSQINEYFNGSRTSFDIPVQLNGTDLQLKVWNALMQIPYGKTVAYSDIAKAVGCKSVRAVATAIGKNPIPVIIPCHRVIRKNGVIGKFSLIGPEIKKFLLETENKTNIIILHKRNHCKCSL